MADARILIVEDEAPVAEDIRKRLESMGYAACGVASSGREAVSMARQDAPDLVLMDILPTGEAEAAADPIRQELGLPVVYLTDDADGETFRRAKDGDAFGFVLKPFQDRELHAAIEMALYKHRLEAELRARQQWLLTTLDSIGDAVIRVAPDGTVLFMNRVAEDLTGWQQDEAVGRPLEEVFAVKDEQHGWASSRRTSGRHPAAPAPDFGELGPDAVLVRADGTSVPISDTVSPISDEKGGALGAVIVFHDTTERRRAERKVRELQKMDTVGRLAGGVAHHFNNLLTVIMGNAQLLKSDPLAVSDLNETLDQILEASRQAADLTTHLLAFARMGPHHVVPLALNDAVRTAADMLSKTIDRRVRVRQDLRAQSGLAMADPSQIQSALLNLGLNACDAMPEGGQLTFATRLVTLDEDDCREAAHEIRPGSYVEIAVTDTGVGMDAETRQRVFEPFFTTKQVGQGTGMGLASVYACVQNHNGTVEVESAPGEGTTVRMFLPVTSPPGGESEAALPSGEAGPGKPKGHILIVDDEKAVADLAAKILQRDGYAVSIALDGAQGVDFYRKHHGEIDLVILDLVMPEMDGRQAFVQMRAVNPNVRALLSSGYSRSDMPKSILEEGVLGFLAKPYQIQDLSRAVARYLGTSAERP